MSKLLNQLSNYGKYVKIKSTCERVDLPDYVPVENRWYSKEYARGFNACIDEIKKRGAEKYGKNWKR